MRYVTISPDGTVALRGGPLDLHPGGPGVPARVELDPRSRSTAFVGDAAQPRNVVGSCVLTVLGAAPRPYGGTVVLTGWHDRGETAEISDLPVPFDTVLFITCCVRRALDGEPPADGDFTAGWAAAVRTFAARVRAAADPPTTTLLVPGGVA
ncbi:hypothetical protein GCM10009802_02800 [Streptomyces synnematoformans]|uniref:Uncharacterized protein n=1 Tax=Streptomyces synnematoformans TaxID=415721 RepID=A0ABP5IW11_9ACTN